MTLNSKTNWQSRNAMTLDYKTKKKLKKEIFHDSLLEKKIKMLAMGKILTKLSLGYFIHVTTFYELNHV